MNQLRVSRIFSWGVAALAVACMLACGTILYPERRRPEGPLPKGAKLDAGVVVMDGVLLLLWIIPGVVAFGVDFATGAIYMPGSGKRGATLVPIPSDGMTCASLRGLLAEHTGGAAPELDLRFCARLEAYRPVASPASPRAASRSVAASRWSRSLDDLQPFAFPRQASAPRSVRDWEQLVKEAGALK